MPIPYSAIIFDMDGTLVASESVWEDVEAQMFADRGLDYTEEIRQQVIGLRLDEFFAKLISIFSLDETADDLRDELIGRMLKRIPSDVEPKPGARELLDYAQQLGIPYCIASSSPMSIIESVVQAQGWADLIPHLYTADSVERGKPAPDVYLYAAEQLGVSAGQCLALEDSPAGARSAVAAGMTTFVVPDFHTRRDVVAQITPHVYDSLFDVLEHLQEHA